MPPPALRHYQERVVDGLLKAPRGGIAMMATGAGKTFVAAEVLRRLLGDDPTNRAVFVVPAVPLVQQQRAALSEYYFDIGRVVGVNKDGRIANHQILVITHGSLWHAVTSGTIALDDYKCVVFDEVHHCRGDHQYRLIARMLTESFPSVRVVGLTASIAYGTNEGDIARDIATLLDDLGLEEDGSTIFAVDDDELKADGFRPEMLVSMCTRTFAAHVADFELPLGDHQLVDGFFNAYRSGRLHSIASQLVDETRAVEAALRRRLHAHDDRRWHAFVDNFASGKRGPPPPPLAEWERSLREVDDGQSSQSLGLCYAALRIIIASSQRDVDLAAAYVRQYLSAHWTGVPMPSLLPTIAAAEPSFRRIASLHAVLRKRFEARVGNGKDFRAIVFVRLQVATIILSREIQYLQQQTAMTSHKRLRPHHFTSSKDAATTLELSMTAAKQEDVLQKFRDGEYNVLIATTVAEEGLDVTGVDLVVFFDPKDNLVSYVQSMGRARDNCSKVVVLGERKAVQYFETAKSLQHSVVKNTALLRSVQRRSEPKLPSSPSAALNRDAVRATLACLMDKSKDVKMRLNEALQKLGVAPKKDIEKVCACPPFRKCEQCATTRFRCTIVVCISHLSITRAHTDTSKTSAANACSSLVTDAVISALLPLL